MKKSSRTILQRSSFIAENDRALVSIDTAIITRLRIHCGARSIPPSLSFSRTIAVRGYIACAIYRIASSNPIAAIRGRGPCNSDLARHGTRFYWQFSIGPHLGYEATCIANKRSSRVKNNDIVTDHYAAEHNDYYRSLLLTSSPLVQV